MEITQTEKQKEKQLLNEDNFRDNIKYTNIHTVETSEEERERKG